jgi:HD-GYP domain-containing protein (c-di-GMP phosphodiesterase class II)
MLSNGKLYTTLFQNILNAFAHCRAIYDEQGKMIDWVYLLVNPAFERHVNLKGVTGKRASELMPTLLETNPEVFERFGRVSQGSTPETFELYVESLDRSWFSVNVYSVESGTFTEIFNNITPQKQAIIDLEKSHDEMMQAWGSSLEARDPGTLGHTERVTKLTAKLARKIGVTEADIAKLQKGSFLHDVAKISIPDSILKKEAPLTDDEWGIMKTHPQRAYDMISKIESLKDALDIPYCHHEKYNGTGYPRGLEGEAIPLPARIFSIVDVWDALTSDRSYRKAWTKEKTLEYIQSLSGIDFDPAIVPIFIEMIAAE